MTAHISATIKWTEVTAALTTGTLPELIAGGVIFLGSLWILKKIIVPYLRRSEESVKVQEHGEGKYYLAPT